MAPIMKSLISGLVILAFVQFAVSSEFTECPSDPYTGSCDSYFKPQCSDLNEFACYSCRQRGEITLFDVPNGPDCHKIYCCSCSGNFGFEHYGRCDRSALTKDKGNRLPYNSSPKLVSLLAGIAGSNKTMGDSSKNKTNLIPADQSPDRIDDARLDSDNASV